MNKPQPSAFHPELSIDRLTTVASWLLEEHYATQEDLVRDTDNGYTHGCTTFMRQRVRIMKEAASGKHAWLSIANQGNDLVFSIEGIPCRFSNDDPHNPRKEAVTTANRHQESFLDFDDDKAPTRFCFVIDQGIEDVTDPHVEFLGFTAAGSLVTHWISSKVRAFQVAGEQPLVQSVPVQKPLVAPKRRGDDIDDIVDGQS